MDEHHLHYNVLFKVSLDNEFLVVSAQFEDKYAFVKILDDLEVSEDDREAVIAGVKNILAERVKKEYREGLIK